MDKTFRAVTSLPWRVEKIQSDLGTPFEKGVPPLRHPPVKWYTKTGHGGGRFWTGYMLRFNTVYIVHKHCSPIK